MNLYFIPEGTMLDFWRILEDFSVETPSNIPNLENFTSQDIAVYALVVVDIPIENAV